MTGHPILSPFQALGSRFQARFRPNWHACSNLHAWWQRPELLPPDASETPTVMRTLDLLGPLDWGRFPERDLLRHWVQPAVSYAAFSAAMLVRLNEGLKTIGALRRHLVEHPGFIPLLGFRVVRSRAHPCGFDPDASLPTQRHLTRMLREMPNAALQFLLADTVRLIRRELRLHHIEIGECISLDTKHILAWVKENNPKAYVETRFDKTRQPAGDLDCKLGCKRRHNKRKKQPLGQDAPPTPTTYPLPADHFKFGDFY